MSRKPSDKRAISVNRGLFKPSRRAPGCTRTSPCPMHCSSAALSQSRRCDPCSSFDLSCIIEIKDIVDIAVNRQNHLFLSKRLAQQRPGCFGFEDVVGHQQQEIFMNHVACAQNRNAIVFSVIGVFDPGHLRRRERVVLIPLLDGLAPKSHDDHESLRYPAWRAPLITCSRRGVPFSGTSGFGPSPDRAAMRLPLPAARIKASLVVCIVCLHQ